MIAISDFIAAVKQNASRVKEYHQPGDGSNGQCDCIGLIIGAKQLAGGTWTGTHGSNYAARSETLNFGPISGFYLGEIVYKYRPPGHEYYKLPDKYKKGGKSYNGDINDYYHIGVVTSVSPLEITHCTDPGPIARDSKQGKWSYGGMLKGVDYGKGDETMPEVIHNTVEESIKETPAIVISENMGSVKLRAKPSTSCNTYWDVPYGSTVYVLEPGEYWTKIKYNSRVGYMMSKFLTTKEETEEEIVVVKKEVEKAYKLLEGCLKQIFVSKSDIEKAYDILGDMLGLRG